MNSSSRSRGVRSAVVAIPRDRQSLHELHDEVGSTAVGRPGVENLGNIGVVHHRQGLSLRFEPGDDLAAVQPRLDDLQCDRAAHGVRLFGQPHRAHAALANLLHQLIRADDRARTLRAARAIKRWSNTVRCVEQLEGALMGLQQCFDLLAQAAVVPACFIQERRPVLLHRQLDGLEKDRSFIENTVGHRCCPWFRNPREIRSWPCVTHAR